MPNDSVPPKPDNNKDKLHKLYKSLTIGFGLVVLFWVLLCSCVSTNPLGVWMVGIFTVAATYALFPVIKLNWGPFAKANSAIILAFIAGTAFSIGTLDSTIENYSEPEAVQTVAQSKPTEAEPEVEDSNRQAQWTDKKVQDDIKRILAEAEDKPDEPDMDPAEARSIALKIYNRLKEIEKYLMVAVEAHDVEGFRAHVKFPLIRLMREHANHSKYYRETYIDCIYANSILSNIADDLERDTAVERFQYLEVDLPEYQNEIKLCKQAIDSH